MRSEERHPNATKNEIIELAAEALSRAADKAVDESDFARRLVSEGQGADSTTPAAEAAGSGAGAPGLEQPNSGAVAGAIPPGAVSGGREQPVTATATNGAVRFLERPASQ